jgi:hypothetical protein
MKPTSRLAPNEIRTSSAAGLPSLTFAFGGVSHPERYSHSITCERQLGRHGHREL